MVEEEPTHPKETWSMTIFLEGGVPDDEQLSRWEKECAH
jgi:hypothetical protein